MKNKKKIEIILLSIICLLIVTGIALIFFDVKENDIDKTEKIIVEELFGEYDTKEITNKEDIDKIKTMDIGHSEIVNHFEPKWIKALHDWKC